VLKDINRFKMFPEALIAYQGHSLLITGVHGQIRQGIEGFYHHQTRFLQRMDLSLDGLPLTFVSANPVDPYSFISYYLAPSPAGERAGPPPDGGGEIMEKGIEIQLNGFVGDGIHMDVYLTNHGLVPTTLTLAWDFAADFADLTEAVEGHRRQEAPVTQAWHDGDDSRELRFRYMHADLAHETLLRFPVIQGSPTWENGKVCYRLHLEPQVPVRFCMALHPVFCGERHDPVYGCDSFRSHETTWDRAREDWYRQVPRLKVPSTMVQDAWDRAVSDLGSLPLYDGQGPEIYTPAAGIPIYQALFGRDTLTTVWQAGLVSPLMLRGTLETLAHWLGSKRDDRYDEQVGRVIHQHQLSPLALLGLTPFLRYYGDYAGPGLFLIGLGWDFMLTGDRDFQRRMQPHALRVLEWMDREGDRDGDGFYEYETRAGDWGTKNQGWKDSDEAVLYLDGACVPNPIASVEIQGYYFVAKQLIGQTFLAMGDVARGLDLIRQAEDLKKRFNQAFWLEEGALALALDAEKRQVPTIASNMGHCLACGIVDQDKAAAVAGRLMAPDMFTGWGIRTLSSLHPAYNPFAYHLGSVWPSENGSIAFGFKRYGLNGLVHDLARGLFEATLIFDENRLPEAMGGHARDRRHPHPGIYPQSNAPQAWSASAIPMLIQAFLGIRAYAPLNSILIDPSLPEWLPELSLSNIPVGSSRVSLHFWRDASGETDYRILDSHGHPHVLRQPPANHLSVGLFNRLGDLVESLLPH
jgi:glycogen debranching enzyme